MKKAIAAGLVLTFVVAVAVVLAQTDIMEIGYISKIYQPTKFTHKAHATLYKDCKTCHHEWDGKAKIEKCTTCHKAQAEGTTPDMKTAFHNQCKGCHTKEKQAGKNAPVGCTDCHAKKATQ